MYKFILIAISLIPSFAFEELVNIAYQNSNIIKEAQKEIEIKSYEVDLSDKLNNPSLSFAINDLLLDDISSRDREAMQSQGFSISQKLPINSKLKAKKNTALQSLEFSKIALESIKSSLRKNILQEYLKLQNSQENLNLISEYKTILEDMKNLHSIYNLSSQTHFEPIIKSKILISNLKLKESKLKREIELSHIAILDLINEEKLNIDTKPPTLIHPSIESINGNLELKAKNVKLNTLKSKVKFNILNKIPDVTLNLGVFQRESRDEYINFSLTIPLNIYGNEEIQSELSKVKLSKEQLEYLELRKKISNTMKSKKIEAKSYLDEIEILNRIKEEQKTLLNQLKSSLRVENSLNDIYLILKELLDIEFLINEKILKYNLVSIEIEQLGGKI